MKHYQNHEFAGLLPATADDDYHRILDDIRANGQRVPIILFQGKILDGRTRYRACLDLRQTPRFEVFRGTEGDALRYVASHNLYRRHLTPSQKAMAANAFAKYLERVEGLSRQQAKRKAAITANVNERLMEKAERVTQEQPEDIPAIVNGSKTLNESDVEIRNRIDPLAHVRRRLLEVASAAGRFEQAVRIDLQDARYQDVQQLATICESIMRGVEEAERLIERVGRELVEDET